MNGSTANYARDRYEICDIEWFMESSIDQKRMKWVVRLGVVGWLAILGSAMGYAWSAQGQRFDEGLLRQVAADRDRDTQSAQPLRIPSETLQRSSGDSPK